MSDAPNVDTATIKRRIPIPFFLNLAANSASGLATDAITGSYKIVRVQAHFRDDAANLLQVWAFVSRNHNAVGSLPPPDNKILGFYSPTPYLVGEGEIVSVDCDIRPDITEKYIKVYFWNGNAYAMSGYCVITIEIAVGGEASVEIGVGGADERKYTYEEWSKIIDVKSHAVYDQTVDILKGSPPWLAINPLLSLKGQGETQTNWAAKSGFIATMTNYFTPDMHVDDFYGMLMKWYQDANALMDSYNGLTAASGIVEMFGYGAIGKIIERDEKIWGIVDQMRKVNEIVFENSMNLYAEYNTNYYFTAKIPQVSDLINMVVKEKITLDYFKEQMRKQGYTLDWSQKIWDAHFIAPDFETVKRAYWREGITKTQLPEFLKLVDLDPRYNEEVWLRLTEEIPQYADLINMRVKEVITQETFKKGLEYQGYYGAWADRLWDAHFTPAGFTDFLTAMRRKLSVNIPVAEGTPKAHTFGLDELSDIQAIKDLSVLADYDPRYWDFFKTRMYNDPSYRMIMWGFETDSIKRPEIPDLVHRLGLNPKDESWYTNFLVHFQERPWINRYLTSLQTAYIQGAITENDLKQRVSVIPRNEEIANWMIKIANIRKEILAVKGVETGEKLISLGELKQMRFRNIIDNERFRAELLQRGYTLMDIETLIELFDTQYAEDVSGGEKKGLTIAELFDGFRYGEMSEDELRTNLALRGMAYNDIRVLIETKKKKWAMGNVEVA
jgi:hypothetical protein